MAVADDALAEILDVALLILNQATPGLRRPRLVPAIDRPLGLLRAVVVPQRLPAQSIARIARQISGHVSNSHPIPIALDAAGVSLERRSGIKRCMVMSACAFPRHLLLHSLAIVSACPGRERSALGLRGCTEDPGRVNATRASRRSGTQGRSTAMTHTSSVLPYAISPDRERPWRLRATEARITSPAGTSCTPSRGRRRPAGWC